MEEVQAISRKLSFSSPPKEKQEEVTDLTAVENGVEDTVLTAEKLHARSVTHFERLKQEKIAEFLTVFEAEAAQATENGAFSVTFAFHVAEGFHSSIFDVLRSRGFHSVIIGYHWTVSWGLD